MPSSRCQTMVNDKATIAICNFNTTELTNNCVESIFKNVYAMPFRVVVLDNSSQQRFTLRSSLVGRDVQVIDNTKMQVIDFKKMHSGINSSTKNFAAFDHTFSIQFLMNVCQTKKLVILDSDTIVVNDFDFLLDNSNIIVSDIQQSWFSQNDKINKKTRFIPFVQMLDIEMLRAKGISYFQLGKIQCGMSQPSQQYDTGSWLYEQAIQKNVPIKQICFAQYVKHLFSGSENKSNPTKFFSLNASLRDRQYDCIVSLTSFPKRYTDLAKTLQSLLDQRTKLRYRIVLCLTDKDMSLLPMKIKILAAMNDIELLTAKEDILGHKKYFYTMQKYKDLPIITVDDDSIYSKDLVQLLYDNYKKYPHCISGMKTHKVSVISGNMQPYQKWQHNFSANSTPSFMLHAVGVGGILYPPNAFSISDNDLVEIKKSLHGDDLFLKKKELSNGLKVSHVIHTKEQDCVPLDSAFSEGALSYGGCNMTRNDQMIKAIGLDRMIEEKYDRQ